MTYEKCIRCGCDLERKHCSDVTCPFSDYVQSDLRGWTGHPDSAHAEAYEAIMAGIKEDE